MQHALLTKFRVAAGDRPAVLAILAQTTAPGILERFYGRVGDDELLVTAYAASAAALTHHLHAPPPRERERLLTGYLAGDYHRQLLAHVETALDRGVALTGSAYLQLRYIEVPHRVHADYLLWRERTIFKHVRSQELIDSFHAYHTSLSTEPGVLFFSGFSCAPGDYLACFDNEAYKAIVREAGDRYIAGGAAGLHTKIYERLS
jgi:hypothetical protein